MGGKRSGGYVPFPGYLRGGREVEPTGKGTRGVVRNSRETTGVPLKDISRKGEKAKREKKTPHMGETLGPAT